MTSSVPANGKKKEHTATPYETPLKKSRARKKVVTVSQAVDVIIKDAMKNEDDENISTAPKASDILKKGEDGRRDNMSWLQEDAKPTRTCSSMDRKSPFTADDDWDRPRSEIAKGSNTVIPVSSRSTPSKNVPTESIDNLWLAVEQAKSENKVCKDYTGVPLIPIQLPGNSVGRAQSREGLLLSPPVSRYKGSISSVSGDDHAGSDSDGSGPESRASSVMSVSQKSTVPTPRPPSSRKMFFLSARPKSTKNNDSDSDSNSSHKPLVGGSALDTDGRSSTSSQADDMVTPTFEQHLESPRIPRQRVRMEPTVSSLIRKKLKQV